MQHEPKPPFDRPGQVAAALLAEQVSLLCDFDGTLVGIAGTPDGITVPAGLSSLLCRVRDRLGGRFAIVSGREVEVLTGFLPGYDGDIWGGHGATARLGGDLHEHPLTDGAEVAALQDRMEEIADEAETLLETKPTGAVIHYREDPSRGEEIADALGDMLPDHPDFERHASKMAWEVRPTDVSKAAAVAHMRQLHPDAPPVMIGDDVTDEEAMRPAIAAGGFGIRVGGGETLARFRLATPADTIAMLCCLAGENP